MINLKNEQWKDIPNYEGYYQVSNLGRVRSLNRVIQTSDGVFRRLNGVLKNQRLLQDYYMVDLTKDNKRKSFRTHVLVALAFLDYAEFKNRLVVDHIDNDSKNNNLNNLQLITQRENSSKDRKNKTSRYTGVSFVKRSNKWKAQIYYNQKIHNLGEYKTEYEAHKAYQARLNKITI